MKECNCSVEGTDQGAEQVRALQGHSKQKGRGGEGFRKPGRKLKTKNQPQQITPSPIRISRSLGNCPGSAAAAAGPAFLYACSPAAAPNTFG